MGVFDSKYLREYKSLMQQIDDFNEKNEKYIKEIFWKYNSIQYSTEKVSTEDGKYKTILKIKITSKSKE